MNYVLDCIYDADLAANMMKRGLVCPPRIMRCEVRTSSKQIHLHVHNLPNPILRRTTTHHRRFALGCVCLTLSVITMKGGRAWVAEDPDTS